MTSSSNDLQCLAILQAKIPNFVCTNVVPPKKRIPEMLTDFFVFILSQEVFLVPSFENSGTFGEVTLSLLKCFL